MNKFRYAALLLVFLTAGISAASQSLYEKDFSAAKAWYDAGMYEKAAASFERLSLENKTPLTEGYLIMCRAAMKARGYDLAAQEFLRTYPYSELVPQLRYRLALNCFEAEDYAGAMEQFELVSPDDLDESKRDECNFKTAFSLFKTGDYITSAELFKKVSDGESPDYAAPARYTLGYLNYQSLAFKEACEWFVKASVDPRFKAMSLYYIVECRFMLKDYDFVMQTGPAMLEQVDPSRHSHLARMISESFLISGKPEDAKSYYELSRKDGEQMASSDYFYAGSVYYALGDYEGAVRNYTQMTDRTDSIGQLASYQLGYSYIKTRNKVAAMEAFREASGKNYDAAIAEDAYFNYAKLAFDLNNDPSAFTNYLNRYKNAKRGDTIYGYMAVAALLDRNYSDAVAAFNNIDYLNDDMRSNYMKANYLRANELIQNGSWRQAVPCLKVAAYYADKKSRLGQLSGFWLAESYFRDGNYEQAKDKYSELYNASALYGAKEYDLIPYGVAYCYFKEGNYAQAIKWFDEYLSGSDKVYRKGAALRKADCYFMQTKYQEAAAEYDRIINDYFDINDIYPYYQDALCYGLMGKNQKKIDILANVTKADPASTYYSDALLELGRAYVAGNDVPSAENCFNMVLDNGRDSTVMARALLEMGMISRNAKDYDRSLSYYKRVVERMPYSEYVDDALAAIESVYQSKNEPYEYLSYMENIGRSPAKTDEEKETMIFNAAEQIFLSENYERALASLQQYQANYPSGKFLTKADFYIAECLRSTGQKEKACDYYSKVVEAGNSSFTELAMLNFSNLSFSLQKYDDAYGGYSYLKDNALIEANKFTAVQGMMRSAYKGHRYAEAADAARTIQKDKRSGTSLVREAKYTEAKSCMGMSERGKALEIFAQLAKSPSTAEGAEASYILIQDCFDRGDFDKVEKMVYSFADSGSGDQYWLAKSFVTLGDAFFERNDPQQAKATWESVLSGYKSSDDDDDIYESVRTRLAKLDNVQ